MAGLIRKIRSELAPLFTSAPAQIDGITPSSWNSPLQPIAPFITGTGVRQWDLNPGLNLQFTPRGDQRVTFQQLRAFSQSFDLCAMIIDKKKREAGSWPWQIRVKPVRGEKKSEFTSREKIASTKVDKFTRLFEFPDGVHSFDQWVGMWLDDVLVCDAGSILPVKNRLGEVFQLRVISGSTITPIVDEQGFTPLPPNPAYQQVILGLPISNLTATSPLTDDKAPQKRLMTADQLIYRPRNPRPYTRWGCSPVERIIVTLDIASNRQQYLLDYYTEGTVPEGFIFASKDWTPDQIKTFQTWLDNMLAGNLAQRRRIIVAPPADGGKGVEWAKKDGLTDATEDYLIKLVCYAFDESPQNLIKQMNRAAAEKSSEVSKEAGNVPLANYMKSTFNYIIQYVFGESEVEFAWASEPDIDPVENEKIWQIRVANAGASRNEWREAMGMDASPEPNADELTLQSGTTIVLLSQIDQLDAVTGEDKASGPQGAGGKTPTPKEKKDAAKKQGFDLTANISDDRFPIRASKEMIEDAILKILGPDHEFVVEKRAQHVVHGHAEFHGFDLTAVSAHSRNNLEAKFDAFFAEERFSVAKQVLAAYGPSKVRKGESMAQRAERIAAEVVIGWASLFDATVWNLTHAAVSGVEKGSHQLVMGYGDDGAQIVADAVEPTKVMVKHRAAELIGMKLKADGSLVPSKSATMTITDTTREALAKMIKEAIDGEWTKKALALEIENSYQFSAERAAVIAKQEIGRAQSYGNFEAWKASKYILETKWVLSSDHPCCDNCDSYAAKGSVPVGHEYAPGVFAPPDAHPNCQCALVVSKTGRTK